MNLPPNMIATGFADEPSDDLTVTSVFVYGTLKRGQCRERCWPRRPETVQPATIAGRLHDLGPYPALLEGVDRILGELWKFDLDDMPETLRALDEVECYGTDDVDLYVRRIIACTTEDGATVRAFTYYLANPAQANGCPVVPPNAEGLCVWPLPKRRGMAAS